MAFNVGRGLAAAGEAVGKFAGVAALEMQKSELQRESLTLANQLATERESKGRAEAHGFDMEKQGKQQEFLSGESKLDRENRLQATNISAGASLSVARMGLQGRQMEIDAMAPLRAAQIDASKATAEGTKLDNELKASQVKARKELEAATTSGDQAAIDAAKAKVSVYDEGAALRAKQAKALDTETQSSELKLKADKLVSDAKDELLAAGNDPAKVAEAKRKLSILESSTAQDRQEIALWQQQAKLAEQAMVSTMTRLTTLQNSGLLTDESKALEQMLQKMLKQQRREFEAATRQAKALLDALDPNARKGATGTDAVIDPNQFVKPKPTAAAPKPAPPRGLTDQQTPILSAP